MKKPYRSSNQRLSHPVRESQRRQRPSFCHRCQLRITCLAYHQIKIHLRFLKNHPVLLIWTKLVEVPSRICTSNRIVRFFFFVDLLAAIEERTIPALEEAIQQVKDHNFLHQLKYECERALELLHRLMKIEHMK